jgi:transcriptional regulator with XRE-family HTH domain
MNFQDLHESLRLELLRRINLGTLTGTALARQAGFRQAHISNFLNRKRSLSLDGLDRVLKAQNLTVDQIMPLELSASSSGPSPAEQSEIIPVVTPSAAMEEAVLRPGSIIETIHVPASRLQDNRGRPHPKYAHWQRFVAIRADAQQTAAMEPMIPAGSIVVLDRHYNSLAPYRAHQQTLYVVRCGTGLVLRFVEFDDGRLVLRPLSLAFPVQLIALDSHETPADYIVGRVCLAFSEL